MSVTSYTRSGQPTLADPFLTVAVDLSICTMAMLRLALKMVKLTNPRQPTIAKMYLAGIQGRHLNCHALQNTLPKFKDIAM